MIATLSAALELPRPVVVAMLGLWAVLIAASALVLALRARDEARYRELTERTASWWWMRVRCWRNWRCPWGD